MGTLVGGVWIRQSAPVTVPTGAAAHVTSFGGTMRASRSWRSAVVVSVPAPRLTKIPTATIRPRPHVLRVETAPADAATHRSAGIPCRSRRSPPAGSSAPMARRRSRGVRPPWHRSTFRGLRPPSPNLRPPRCRSPGRSTGQDRRPPGADPAAGSTAPARPGDTTAVRSGLGGWRTRSRSRRDDRVFGRHLHNPCDRGRCPRTRRSAAPSRWARRSSHAQAPSQWRHDRPQRCRSGARRRARTGPDRDLRRGGTAGDPSHRFVRRPTVPRQLGNTPLRTEPTALLRAGCRRLASTSVCRKSRGRRLVPPPPGAQTRPVT